MAKCYSITKWRKNSKNTGALLSLGCYDEESEQWFNVKANVQFAANHAGKDADELPAAVAKIDKEGNLLVKVRVFDDYVPTQNNAKKKNARRSEETLETCDDDDDLSF